MPGEVRAYHLDAESVVLLVRPRWRTKWLGRQVNWVNAALGNLVLPHEDRVHAVTNRLAPMKAEGWVFSVRSTSDGVPMFRFAHGTFGGSMRVIAPLPLGALDALLDGRGTDPYVLSANAIYWVLGPVRVRLPLHERLDGRVAQGHFLATQTFWLFGQELVRMEYAIAVEPDPSLLSR